MNTKTKLYKYNADFGRMGDLEGVFEATDDQIKNLIGDEVYFGEVLGKHSEIVSVIQEDQIDMVTDDQEFIEKARDIGLIPSGHNPLAYQDEFEE